MSSLTAGVGEVVRVPAHGLRAVRPRGDVVEDVLVGERDSQLATVIGTADGLTVVDRRSARRLSRRIRPKSLLLSEDRDDRG